MARLLVIIFLLSIANLSFSNPYYVGELIKPDTVYSLSDVDTEPALEAGMESLYRKWNSFVKYPTQARKDKIEGRVFISFVIDENGDMGDLKVERGLGRGCDEAAVDALIKTKLKWTPATKGGEAVKVRLFLPFSFKLK